MKVLHLPTSVGGNSYELSRAERKLGLQADVLYQTQNYLGYPGDIVLDDTGSFPKMFAKSVAAAFKIPQQYDVFHFNFGSTLIDIPERGIHHWDLPLYKGKRVCITYNGCDARMKYRRMVQTEISACSHADCTSTLCRTKKLDDSKAKRIKQFEDFGASFFSLNPDLMHFLPKSTVFLPYTISGWDALQATPVLAEKDAPLKIVHAPTNQVIKGTKPLLAAIDRLTAKYPGKFELILVENTSHEEALSIYRQADIVIDQLRVGWFGAFAVEAMKMGKPVVAYINHEDLVYLPRQMASDVLEAFIEANEFDVEQVLEQYIYDPSQLPIKSSHSLEFVHKWYNPIEVAKTTKSIYEM